MRLRHQLANERNQRAAAAMRCEELEAANARLQQQLDAQCQQSTAAPSHSADRLTELEQLNARLRQKLAGVQAAAALTQAGAASGTASQQQRQPQQQNQTRQHQHLPQEQQPQQQDPQLPPPLLSQQLQQQQPGEQQQQQQSSHSLDASMSEAAGSGAEDRDSADTGDRDSADTTRAVCTLSHASSEDAAPARPSLREPRDGGPPAPLVLAAKAKELEEQRTPCSRPPPPHGGRLAVAGPCRNLSLEYALQEKRELAAAGNAPAPAAPAGFQQPAAASHQGRQMSRTPASAPPPRLGGHQPAQQPRQQAQPQTEVRKGWRQKRKAGDAESMLASQKPGSRFRPDRQAAAQQEAQPPALLPQPTAPDSLACTAPEQWQSAGNPAQLAAPDWCSPAEPAAAAAHANQNGAAHSAQPGPQLAQPGAYAPAQQQLQGGQPGLGPAAAPAHAPANAAMPPPARPAPRARSAGPAAKAGPAMRAGDPGYKFTGVVRRKSEREVMQVCKTLKRFVIATEH